MTEAMASLIIALGKNASDYIMFIENAIRFPRVLTPNNDLVIVLRKKIHIRKAMAWQDDESQKKVRGSNPVAVKRFFFSWYLPYGVLVLSYCCRTGTLYRCDMSST